MSSEGTEMQPAAAEAQPVEAAASTEPIEKAADGAFVSVGPTVLVFFGLALLALFVVATPIEWYRRITPAEELDIGLFSTKYQTATVRTITYTAQLPPACDEMFKRLRATSAFAVISVVLSGLLLIAAIAARLTGKGMGAALALAVGVCASSLTAWAMGMRIFYQAGLCPLYADNSLWESKYEIGAGLALFVTGWVLSVFAVGVAAVNPKVPALIPDAALDKVAGLVYVVLSFAAFVFVVIGTPVSIVYVWFTPGNYFRATMWHVYHYTLDVRDVMMTFGDFTYLFLCGNLYKFAHFAQAFAIIAIAFMFFAFIAGVLFAAGKIGKKAPMVLGLLGTLTALICAAACATIYYRRFCNVAPLTSSLHELKFQLAAGVALFVAAVLCLAVATIIVTIIALVEHIGSGAKGGNVKPTAFLLLIGGVISLFFLVLGASQPLFMLNQDEKDYIKVTWWNQLVQSNGGANFAEVDFGCSELSTRLVGGGALEIISIFFIVVTLLLGIAQLVNAGLRKAASIAGLLSSLCQLVAWGLAVTVYTGTFCSTEYYAAGYDIGVGLGLVIASWCLTTVVSVLNLLVAAE